MTAKLEPTEKAGLRQFLASRFSLEELRNLAFDLGADCDLFTLERKQVFPRELIEYFERRDRLSCLVAEVLKQRPDNDLARLLAKLPACSPSPKIQIIVSSDLVEDISGLLDELAARLKLDRGEVVLVGAAQGSMRLLISLPEKVADLQILTEVRSLGEGKYQVSSIVIFDSLDLVRQNAWRWIACEHPPILQGSVLRPAFSWQTALDVVRKSQPGPHNPQPKWVPPGITQRLPMTNLIGQTLLDQYRVDAFVASGGMGAVYRVLDLKRNVPLAMKVLHADLAEDPSVFKRFEREGRALKKLAHPNIVPFYGLFKTSDFAFLLEQYVDGPTLKDVLRQRKALPVEEALIYLKALCAALGYAHAHSVVHCDVKPGNVMIDQGGSIYLTDFGVARHAESTTTTLGGAGTPAYMAPEQCRSEPVTAATDVYAVGIILYEMVTGTRPFRGGGTGTKEGTTAGEQIRYAHLHTPPPDPCQANLMLHRAFGDVILKGLEKDPQARYSTIWAMLEAACAAVDTDPHAVPNRVVLDHILTKSLAGAEPSLLPLAPAADKKRALPLTVAGIAALILLALIVGASAVTGGRWLRVATPTPTAAPIVVPSFTLAPTPVPAPTDTPTPTETSVPTTTRTPTSTASPTITPSPVKPIVRFWADKTEIYYGQCTTVHWQVEYVKAVYYQGNSAYGTGQDRECPMTTSTVRLTVVYLDGSRRDFTITITILQ